MNPWTGAILSLRVVGDDVDARYAYPSVRRLTSGIRVVPRKESVPLLKRRGFFYCIRKICPKYYYLERNR